MNAEHDDTQPELLAEYQRGATPTMARLDSIQRGLQRRIAADGDGGEGGSDPIHRGIRWGAVAVAVGLLTAQLLGGDGVPTQEKPAVNPTAVAPAPSKEDAEVVAVKPTPPSSQTNEEPIAPPKLVPMQSTIATKRPGAAPEAKPKPAPLPPSTLPATLDPFADASTPDPDDVSTPESTSDDLVRELALVEAARLALNQGQARAALSSLQAHTREFPRGLLVAERELLIAEAQCALGQREAARQTIAAFLRSHPRAALADRAHRLCAEDQNDTPLTDREESAQ